MRQRPFALDAEAKRILHVAQPQRAEARFIRHIAEDWHAAAGDGQGGRQKRVLAGMQAVDQHPGQRRRLLAFGVLVHGEIDDGGQRPRFVLPAAQHRDQGRRESARHGGVQPCGDLQSGIRDQSLHHHRVATGAGGLHHGNEVLQQAVEVAGPHPRLGLRERHRIGHRQVEQGAGKFSIQIRAAPVVGLHDRLDEADGDAVSAQRLHQSECHRGQARTRGERCKEEDLAIAGHITRSPAMIPWIGPPPPARRCRRRSSIPR